jgi:hypothetical protein
MITTADIKPKVLRLWGNPSDTELSPQGLRDAIESVWNIVTMEMSMVSPTYQARFSDTFTLSDGWTGAVPVTDSALITGIEFRQSGGTSEGGWAQIDTTGLENWDYYKANGQPAALLTGGVGGLELRTNFSSLGGEFRIRYIADGQFGDSSAPLAAEVELPSFFSPMFEKGAAAFCGDLIVTDREVFASTIPAKMQGFNNEFLAYLGRYKQWLRASRSGKGVLRRTPSNANRRGTGLHWRGWGFPR